MKHDRIESELQCYVDLSLFDANTGETFSKEFLSDEDKDRVTACEEAIKFLNGVHEDDLAMPKGEIRENITSICDMCRENFERLKAADYEVDSTVFKNNQDTLNAFEAMLDIIDNPEKVEGRTITSFECAEDLSQYEYSLLFCSGECVATMTVEDDRGYTIDMELIVTGDVNVEFNGENYFSPDDFPPELKQAIKDGKYDEEFTAHNNNWFELVYSLTDSSGKEIAYDGDVWESLLDKTTPEQLKADMLDAGINFMEYHIGRESDLFYRSYYEPEI